MKINNKLIKDYFKNSKNNSTSDSYCCNYVNGLHSYSTTEKVVGTYSDGKPLYEKYITGTTELGGTKQVLIDSHIGIAQIVAGHIKASSGGTLIPLNYWSSSTLFVKCAILESGYLNLTTSSNSGYINGNFGVLVRYTKTTD